MEGGGNMLQDLVDSGQFSLSASLMPYVSSLIAAEQRSGKPLQTMSHEEIMDALSFNAKSYIVVSRRLRACAAYAQWLQDRDFAAILDEIKPIDVNIEDGVGQLYPDYRAVWEKVKDCITGSHIPAITALLWLGLSVIDIINLMTDDIQLTQSSMVVRSNNNTYSSSDTLVIDVIKIYMACGYREIVTRTGRITYQSISSDGHFLKKIELRMSNGYIPYNNKRVALDLKSKGIVPTDVNTSGKYWRLYSQGDEDVERHMTQEEYYDLQTYKVWRKIFYGE